jgi:hypothetical protein
MPTIGNNLLPYPNTSDEPNVPKAISDLASAIDTAIGGGARIYQTLAALQAVPSAQLFDGMRAHVVNDPTVPNNGEYIYASNSWSHARPFIYGGQFIGATDANGYVNVPIPMTTAPSFVLVTLGPTLNNDIVNSQDLNVGIITVGSFSVHIRNSTNGSNGGNWPTTFSWLAIWQ